MHTFHIVNESRRDFLKLGGGLTLGLYLPAMGAQAAETAEAADTAPLLSPNAFVRVGTDSSVTVVVKHIEMGQGTFTGLPMLVAEEMDAALAQLKAEPAPADASRYNNLLFGPFQGTGGSTAMANSYEQLRQAGATARAMLVSAAAQTWNVPQDEIRISAGTVSHAASNRTSSFGELVSVAAQLPVPEKVALKDPKDFVYLNGKTTPRLDNKAKITGTAIYTQDIQLPDMLTAVVAHAPRFGASVVSVDDSTARKIPGVVEVVKLPNAVAVLAQDFWAAKKGRDALRVQWDESKAFRGSTAQMRADYNRKLTTAGRPAASRGAVADGLKAAKKRLRADFVFPYLAHATMEPMNCVVKLNRDSCELWYGAQLQTGDQLALAQLLKMKPEQIKLNMLFAGGSFGRRACHSADYVIEAAMIAKAINGRVPVKMVWTREDDMRAGYYRPMYVHRIEAGLDGKGQISAWQHRIVGQSILAGTFFEKVMVKDGIDHTSVEGAANLPYAIDNFAVELTTVTSQVPVLWWRSVGSTHTAYSTETMIDEIAHATKQDAVHFRRALLKDRPRHLGVLNLAAEKALWGQPLPKGKAGEKRGRGVAVHESFNTFVAQIAEVTVFADKTFRVDRVVCAVDCGVAITPDVIVAQMEGGIGYGLSAALHSAITFKDGKVEQGNFDAYPALRINEMPKIEVHIVKSDAKPTGVGEPGTPVIAPAVANALFAATGKRLRTLPFKLA